MVDQFAVSLGPISSKSCSHIHLRPTRILLTDGFLQLVGPLMVSPPKPLPEDIQAFLNKATSGAVYVSMGTAVRLNKDEVKGMAANLAALNLPVIWKISNAELPGKILHSTLSDLFFNVSIISRHVGLVTRAP